MIAETSLISFFSVSTISSIFSESFPSVSLCPGVSTHISSSVEFFQQFFFIIVDLVQDLLPLPTVNSFYLQNNVFAKELFPAPVIPSIIITYCFSSTYFFIFLFNFNYIIISILINDLIKDFSI
jgi:hypothetical protein